MRYWPSTQRVKERRQRFLAELRAGAPIEEVLARYPAIKPTRLSLRRKSRSAA